MITAIAWKNIWRNKKRSIIVIIAVMLGTSAGVFTAGMLQGWITQRIDSVIYTENGHIQIHNPDFLNNEEIGNVVPQSEAIAAFLDQDLRVKGYSKRIKMMAMGTTSRGNTALNLQGIDVDAEKVVSNLYQNILPGVGTFFEKSGSYPIVISDKTAEHLSVKTYVITREAIDSLSRLKMPTNVIEKISEIQDERYYTDEKMKKMLVSLLTPKELDEYGKQILEFSKQYRLRSKIVFTFTDKQGELVSQAFRVCGVYKTDNAMFDQMNAYVLRNDLATLAGLDETEYHEIGIILQDKEEINLLQEGLKHTFPEASILNWEELSPDSAMYNDYMNFFMMIIMAFILLALAFGIINTMLMAILERTKELGMLMAIGMNRGRVFRMIMLETIFLTIVGAFGGMLIGWALIAITGKTGIHLSSVGEGFEAIGWSSSIYPSISLSFFVGITLLVICVAILASIAPARKALKLNPVEAIKSDN